MGMGYTAAVRELVSVNDQKGIPFIPISSLIEARAFDAFMPFQLSVAPNGVFLFAGTQDWRSFLPDGISVRPPLLNGMPDTVDTYGVPSLFLSRFSARDLSRFAGTDYLNLLVALRDLFNRVVGTGIMTGREEFIVGACLDAGLAVKMDARADRSEAWNEAAEAWREPWRLYLQKEIVRATQAARQAAADAALWDKVYRATKAVADLPATAAAAAGSAVSTVAGGFLSGLSLPMLMAVGLVGYYLWKRRG